MPTIANTPVAPIGLGCMPLSVRSDVDEDRAVATIHAALDAGATLLDTADAYSMGEEDVGHNERLIAKALRGRSREGLVVATKGGHTRPGGEWALDGSPAHLRAACEASLAALETETIDLYQFHRPDPDVPYAESVGTLKELQEEGKIRAIGISNADTEQIEEARSIATIEAVQNQLALDYVDPVAKGEVELCGRAGIAFLAWSPLGGISSAASASGEVEPVAAAAQAHGVSPQQIALAWLRSLGPTVVPIPGASRTETARDSQAAADLVLDDAERAAISAAVGV